MYIMTSYKRLRTKRINVWLHEKELEFLSGYSENHLMTVSELVRYWIHEAMKKEGVYKEPSKKVKPKINNKGARREK